MSKKCLICKFNRHIEGNTLCLACQAQVMNSPTIRQNLAEEYARKMKQRREEREKR